MDKQRFSHTMAGVLLELSAVFLVVVFVAVPTSAQGDAAGILKQSGLQGGLIVHLGCGDGTLTAKLHAGNQYLVHGLSTVETDVAAARDRLRGQGLYGPVERGSVGWGSNFRMATTWLT